MLRKLIKCETGKQIWKRGMATSPNLNKYLEPIKLPYQLDKTQINEAIKLEPSLKFTCLDLWKRSHQTFANHGIKTTDFIQMVVVNPLLLSRLPKQIIDGFESWRSCQFGEHYLHLLLIKYPQLLNITDSHHIISRVTYLKEHVSTTKNVWKLLMASPNLMTDSKTIIEQKIDYLVYNMRIEIPEIVKSGVFSESLEKLKCRHKLLERLGIFKPRPIKADPNEPSKNARLHQIIDTSDKSFATKVAYITLAEYESFKDLFERELGNSLDNDSDKEL